VRARDNPFAVERVHRVRYRLEESAWEGLLDSLAALGYRAAIVGPHGHGKTTLLEDLAPRLEARGFRIRAATFRAGERRLGAARKILRDLTSQDVLLIDGAEQLGRLAWLQLHLRSRAAGGLVITSHRPGLLPTLHECRTSPELLAGIVSELLGNEAERHDLDGLFHRHGGNLRGALRELYDVYAESLSY
jgi:hypothetical protein